MDIGSNLKKLRLNKGITIKDACGKQINKGNYWRIEENKVIPRIDTFAILLENMNVSIKDYLELFDEHHNELDQLMLQLKINFERKDIVKIESLILKYEQLEIETGRNIYTHFSALADIYCSRIKEVPYNPNKIEILKMYLFSCEVWTYYEIRMLNNTLFLYDSDTIILFYKKALKFLESPKVSREYDNLKVKISENILMHFIIEKKIKKAYIVHEMLNTLTINESSAYARIIKKWINGIVIYCFEDKRKGLLEIKSTLDILKILDMKNQLNLHKSWTQKILHKNDWIYIIDNL